MAVISLTLFRGLSRMFGLRDATILEHNITQTAGSAGESIAFGVGVTMPAILILGFDLELTRVADGRRPRRPAGHPDDDPAAPRAHRQGTRHPQIPRRHRLRRRAQGRARPPRTAPPPRPPRSAEIRAGAGRRAGRVAGRGGDLRRASASGCSTRSRYVALRLWKDTPEKIFGAPLKAGSVSVEISPELLGVGYIIGPRIGSIMCAGGVLSYLVLIPMIKFFGEGIAGPLAPGTVPIARHGARRSIRSDYILYIGAGAVAAGGLISLLRSLPTIWHGLRRRPARRARASRADDGAAGRIRCRRRRAPTATCRMSFVGIGMVVLLAGIIAVPALHMNILGALLIIVFGFLFVTVSSRLTGEIGSSSNPISGMTVATLLFTCLIFLLIGWTGNSYYVTALSVGRDRLHRRVQRRHDLAGFEDGLPARQHAAPPADRDPLRRVRLGAGARADPARAQQRRDDRLRAHRAGGPGRADRARRRGLTDHERTLAGAQAASDAHEYLTWQKTDDAGGPAGKYLVDAVGQGRLAGRSRHQRHVHQAARRLDGGKVQRAQGRAGVLHHQGHPGPETAVGAGAAGGDDRGGAGNVGHPVAGVRGGGVPAVVVVHADLRRRHDPLAGRCAPAAASALARDHDERGGTGRRERQKPRRAVVERLHRGRGDCGDRRGDPERVLFPNVDTAITEWTREHNPLFDGAWSSDAIA